MARSVAAAAAALALAGVSEASDAWTSFPSLNCYNNQEKGYVGAEALGDGTDPIRDPTDQLSIEECKQACRAHHGCTAIVMQDLPDAPTCWLRKNVQVAHCSNEWRHFTLWLMGDEDEVHKKPAVPRPSYNDSPDDELESMRTAGDANDDPVPRPSYNDSSDDERESMRTEGDFNDDPAYRASGGGHEIEDAGDWKKVAGRNCWTGHGGRAVHWDAAPVSGHKHQSECQQLCLSYEVCEAIVFATTSDLKMNNCYLRKEVHLSQCTSAFAANMDVFIRPKFYGRVMNAWEAHAAGGPGGGGGDGLVAGRFATLGAGAGAAALFVSVLAAAMLGIVAKRTVADSTRLVHSIREECLLQSPEDGGPF